jgi:hypothetical protein
MTIEIHGSHRYHGKDTLVGARSRMKIDMINCRNHAYPLMLNRKMITPPMLHATRVDNTTSQTRKGNWTRRNPLVWYAFWFNSLISVIACYQRLPSSRNSSEHLQVQVDYSPLAEQVEQFGRTVLVVQSSHPPFVIQDSNCVRDAIRRTAVRWKSTSTCR